MTKDDVKKLEAMPFEKALEALESVVAKMESGNLPLDEMMNAFEEGRVLSDICGKKLKAVERKIEVLRSKTGEPRWEEFGEEKVDRMAGVSAEDEGATSGDVDPELF